MLVGYEYLINALTLPMFQVLFAILPENEKRTNYQNHS